MTVARQHILTDSTFDQTILNVLIPSNGANPREGGNKVICLSGMEWKSENFVKMLKSLHIIKLKMRWSKQTSSSYTQRDYVSLKKFHIFTPTIFHSLHTFSTREDVEGKFFKHFHYARAQKSFQFEFPQFSPSLSLFDTPKKSSNILELLLLEGIFLV